MNMLSYTATGTATGDGRNGRVRTSDGLVELRLGIPAELGGAGGEVSNPEQLFAAGYAGCFLSALTSIARSRRVKIPDASVQARITIAGGSDGFSLSGELVATLPGIASDVAEELMTAAHNKCPYSRATRGNMAVTLTLASDGA